MYRLWWRLNSLLVASMFLLPSPTSGLSPDEGFAVLSKLGRTQSLEARFLNIVRIYIGSPYRWGGNSMINGMDCSFFSKQVMRQMGVDLPRTVKEQSKRGTHIRPSRLRTGDLVFFDTSRRRPGVDHVGVYLGEGDFAHSSKGKGVVIESLDEYRHRAVFGRRFRI